MTLTPVRMPKWGLSMQEGQVTGWWKAEGQTVRAGEDLVDIETSKIANVCESPADGVLRRIIANVGETLPVGSLLGVMVEGEASDAEIDAFIAEFQARADEQTEASADESGIVQQTVRANGLDIRAGRAGAVVGTPVVLLHGFAGDQTGWLFNIEPLAARGPVIAIDLPGHGGSSKSVGDGSLGFLADTVAEALSALGLTRVHLIGHSLGAAVAARLAADYPERVAGLVLIAPAGVSAQPINAAFLDGLVDAERARDLRPWLEMLTADPALVTREMVDEVLRFKRLDGAEEALATLRDRLKGGEDAAALRDDLPRIAEALVIVSPTDPIVGPITRADLPPGWRLVLIEGAAHLPHLEKAAEVNARIAEALND